DVEGRTAQHGFMETGSQTIALIAEDDQGARARAERSITVENRFDPRVHGFDFRNWAVGELSEHDHKKISEDEFDQVVRDEWAGSISSYFDISLTDLPEPLINYLVKSAYVMVNQGSAGDGHCYGMAVAAEKYFQNPS
ncbi:MAG: hypothetical protein ABEI52_01700, partial [Halobacteriaceae archaeon]